MRTVREAMKKRAISWLEEFLGTKNSSANDRNRQRKDNQESRQRDRNRVYSIMTFSTSFHGDKARFPNENTTR